MSFTEEKRKQIIHYVLQKIDIGEKDYVKKAVNVFGVTNQTIYRYLKQLTDEGVLKKNGKRYSLVETICHHHIQLADWADFGEDIIYRELIKEYIDPLPNNVKDIWVYAFTEMMNNIIDHSESEDAHISIFQDYLKTTIMLTDNGVGIFNKIKDYYHYESVIDAVNELFKGKFTTDSENHSGEGIFFTSRILDQFAEISSGCIFTHDKVFDIIYELKDIPALANWKDRKGTITLMTLSNSSNKIIKDLFDQYADDDGGFTKTRIPIKNIFDTMPVSRSQAKRLCRGFDRFKEVILDFTDVSDVGQGFAHEIFVVYENAHPDISIVPENANTSIERMIHRVKNS